MATAAASAQDLPAAQGEVRRVDKANGKLTLRHGEIKNLNMPPMTMAFLVKDLAWLEHLQPATQVVFPADQVDGQYTVMSLSPRP